MSVRVANAPLSYGAFEMTVGTDFAVPEPEQVLEAIAAAGYAGTDLGPPGYLGEGDVLRERLEASGLERRRRLRARCASARPTASRRTRRALRHTLDLFDAVGATGARPVLCDAGGPERVANPGRGGEDASLRLDDARWRMLAGNVERARTRPRASAATSPSSTTTPRPTSRGSRRSSACSRTPTSRCCSTPGTSRSRAATPWPRCATGASASARSTSRTCGSTCSRASRPSAPTRLTAWRRGLFCALGAGDVDLAGFCAELTGARLRRLGRRRAGPRARRRGDAFAGARDEQVRNREWLREHAGW